MAVYDTQQRRILLDFLARHPDRGFSVEELLGALSAELPRESLPGRSTLYRLVAKLVDEGLIKRFSETHSRRVQYQIVACKQACAHLHLKCTTCGGLYHMDHALSEQIVCEVLQNSAFSLDEKETVLFGVCRNCQKNRS